VVKIDFRPRIALAEELIEGCDQKVIVFVPLTGALNAVAAELKKRWSVEVVDGSTTMKQRNDTFQRFRQLKDPRVLVANASAMSHGLNLTEASLIIWYAPTTSHDTYVQANARIVRPGQKFPTQIAHIFSTSEERRIYSVLKERGRLQDIILDLASSGKVV
jgi:SNF2 family DNA or RNA helicase